jgi:flavorubredoxin
MVVKEGDTTPWEVKPLKFHRCSLAPLAGDDVHPGGEDNVIFTCDFFRVAYYSDKLYEDEVGDILMPESKRYYADIMMPSRKWWSNGLNKARAFNPKIIAPSHGPVPPAPGAHHGAYEKWSQAKRNPR